MAKDDRAGLWLRMTAGLGTEQEGTGKKNASAQLPPFRWLPACSRPQRQALGPIPYSTPYWGGGAAGQTGSAILTARGKDTLTDSAF